MRTRSQSRKNFPQQEASPVIVEPLRIELPFLEDQFQEDPLVDPPEVSMADNRTMANYSKHPPRQRFDESFYEAWDRFNDLLRACPHLGFFELHQLDTFYNALNVNDQDSLNSTAGGNFLDKMPRECLKIIESKSKFRQTRAKAVVAKVSTSSSTPAISSEVSELKDLVRALLLDKKNQSSAPAQSSTPALVKAIKPNCVTCGGAHSYQNCLATSGNVYRDNIQDYLSQAAAANYNQGNTGFRPQMVANQIRPPDFRPYQNHQNNFNRGNNFNQNRGGNFNNSNFNQGGNFNQGQLHRPQVNQPLAYQAPIPQTLSVTQTDFESYIKANDAVLRNMLSQGSGTLPSNTVTNPKEDLKGITTRSGVFYQGPTIPTQSKVVKQRTEQLHINITLADALILMPKYQKMLKALLSNKEKLQELANTPLNENCSAIILKKLPEKLGDPGKFLIPCGFSELKCKALADLGTSINLMPLSIWKKLGLPELIPTRMTLELANRAICTPGGIARDVFVPVGKFTFPANFVIVDYESDPRVPLILGRPFLRTVRALIDVHGEEMILRDEGCNVLSEKLLDLDSTKDLRPPLHDNPLSGSTTYFSNPFLEEFADELPSEYDDNLQFDIESDLKEIEFLLYQDKDSSLKDLIDQKDLANLADIFVDSIPEMFTDEHALDYSSPPIFDEYDDNFLEVESDAGNIYDDPFDSKGEKNQRKLSPMLEIFMMILSTPREKKIKESKLLIDELDLLCDFHPSSEYDSFISHDFSRVDALPSTNNEDKIFNPSILIQEKPVEIITRVVQNKKLAISNASLVLEDFDPPFYEPLFFKEVPKSKMLLSFSSHNEEKVFKPGIHTSKKFILILSQNYLIMAIKFSKSTRFSKA
nr:reverse transcriptase domain-containing protein [Tanacetum cinerariifolium]